MIRRVLEGFYDPEAARFASLGYMDTGTSTDTTTICGYVNGKNRFGGYVGYRPFFYKVTSDEAHFLPEDSVPEAAKIVFVNLVAEMGCKPPTP